MSNGRFNIAVETSSRHGSVSLGRDGDLLATVDLTQSQRHNVDLVPAIDRLCTAHRAAPGKLGELYVSIGPGSFTGLRIGVATARMLAAVLGVRLVAVPTLEAVARNAPHDKAHVAVCLNSKRDRFYAGLYERDGTSLRLVGEPAETSMAQLLAAAPRPLAIIADPAPEPIPTQSDVHVLPPEAAIPHSEAVWQLGRMAADRGQYTEPCELLPLYARPPEAVALWNKLGRK